MVNEHTNWNGTERIRGIGYPLLPRGHNRRGRGFSQIEKTMVEDERVRK